MNAVSLDDRRLQAIMTSLDTEPLPAASTPPTAARPRPTPWLQTERGQAFTAALGRWFRAAIPPAFGLGLFVLVWQLISVSSSEPGLPGPAKTWAAAQALFADPFYV